MVQTALSSSDSFATSMRSRRWSGDSATIDHRHTETASTGSREYPLVSTIQMKYFVLTPYQQNQFNRLFAHANPLDPHVTGELSGQERCPKCGLIYGSLTWLPPRKAKLSSGRLGDFMWGAGVGLALSERALTAFCKGGVTGLERLDPPIEIVPSRRKSEPTAAQPVYHVVSYSRNGANLDDLA